MPRRRPLPTWKRALQWLLNPLLECLLSALRGRRVVRPQPRPRRRPRWAMWAGVAAVVMGYNWLLTETLLAYLG